MFTLDMATGRALHACPESLQAKALAIEVLSQGLGLVTHTYGMGSDTPDSDRQSMAERAMLGQTVAMAGADILGGVGQLETATVFCPVQAVLDDETGGFLRSLIRTPPVDDEAFNWQELLEIGVGGHFLASPHTLANVAASTAPRPSNAPAATTMTRPAATAPSKPPATRRSSSSPPIFHPACPTTTNAARSATSPPAPTPTSSRKPSTTKANAS